MNNKRPTLIVSEIPNSLDVTRQRVKTSPTMIHNLVNDYRNRAISKIAHDGSKRLAEPLPITVAIQFQQDGQLLAIVDAQDNAVWSVDIVWS